MAFTVNPSTFKISIPKTDLTLVSGTLYDFDTEQFRLDLRAWEWDGNGLTGGVTFTKTHLHNTEVTIVGVTYARFIEIIAPYSVEFEDGQYSIRLNGSNNNIFDVEGGVLVQNQVQVIPGNSAGLIKVSTGSAVTPQDIDDIADAVWDEDATTHETADSTGERLKKASKALKTGEFIALK